MNQVQSYETPTRGANFTRPVTQPAPCVYFVPLKVNIELATFANRDRGSAPSDVEIIQEALEMFADYMLDRVQESAREDDISMVGAWCEYLSRIKDIQGQIITELVRADQTRTAEAKGGTSC